MNTIYRLLLSKTRKKSNIFDSMLINDFPIVFRLHLAIERPLRIFTHCILRSFVQFIFTF